MPRFTVKGYVEIGWTMEVEADDDVKAFEEACQVIEQEKLDAFDIEHMSHLQIFSIDEISE